ncbi:MAG: hypothetical protein DRJ05_05855 [Bacteroidetes bacterium]|nr:MAG: hypothetical protein DRJ05_05855 [Bacteroidota bacterium]
MKNKYLCPKCRALLNVRDHIVFSAENSKKQKGIFLLNADLGNYQMMHDPEFEHQSGDHIDFYCPVCHNSLGIPKVDKDLAEILMIDKHDEEFEIVFSEITGKKLTMMIKDKTIVESFGDDADEFQNYWGEGPKY